MKKLELNQMVLTIGGADGSWKDCASMGISMIGMVTGPLGAVLGLAGMALSAGGCENYLKDEGYWPFS